MEKGCSGLISFLAADGEETHKRTLTQQVYAELLQARVRLAEELNLKAKPKFVLFQKRFYEQGNKSGKILATPHKYSARPTSGDFQGYSNTV